MSFRVAIDVGGTFTDVASLDNATGQIKFEKISTTPTDPVVGILEGFVASQVPVDQVSHFVHGTTLGLNALLMRNGAKTGIITTQGFRDVYLLGRTDRIPMYNVTYRKPAALVERFDIFEIPERLDYQGGVLHPFDDDAAHKVARALVEHGVEAVAICFLHSYANPEHEERMAAVLAQVAPEIQISISSELSRELREYERTSTAVLDAYIKPITRKYLGRLNHALKEEGFSGQFLVTRSGGGAMSVESARQAPVNLILSGPAGGVLGAKWFAETTNEPNLITIDMGGTSLDASLIVEGEPLTHFAASFEGLPINVASLYIHTIGAGGGSIAWLDEAKHLQVGPQSAGASPGPVAYDRGGQQPTFTDAAVHMGYLGNDYALAGSLKLNQDLAMQSLLPLAKELTLTVDEVARGIIRITTTKIVGAVRAITVERGHNPSDFALLSFGGGGGLVALEVARDLSIPHVIIPPGPGAFSAFGMLMANVQHDYTRTRIEILEGVDHQKLTSDFDEMLKQARHSLTSEGFSEREQHFNYFADLRYLGQEHSVTVPMEEGINSRAIQGLMDSFAQAHQQAYGHTMPDPIELVALRLTCVGQGDVLRLPELSRTPLHGLQPIGQRAVCIDDGHRIMFDLYERDSFEPGDVIVGPAIICEHTATTILHEGDSGLVGTYGQITIRVAGVVTSD